MTSPSRERAQAARANACVRQALALVHELAPSPEKEGAFRALAQSLDWLGVLDGTRPPDDAPVIAMHDNQLGLRPPLRVLDGGHDR
jgi:hypothetical protein